MPELATCPACGRQRNTSYTRCPNCGTPQGARPAPPPPLPDRAGLVERGVTSGPRPAPPAGAARDFAALAARAIATAAPLLTLDWHPASLLALDLFCDITWGEDGLSPNDPAWQPNAAQARVIEDSGAFLGEVVRRDGAGRWQDDADPRRAQVVFGDGQRALPLRQMHERLRRGAAASLRAWHVALRRARGARPDAAELEGWLAQAERFRRVGRPDLALAFVREALALPLDAATRHQVERLATSLRQPPAPAVAPPAPVPPPLPATAPGLQQQPVPPKPAPPPATPPPLPRPPWVVAAQGDVVAGQELLRKGQPEAARAAFARALAVDPACGPALLGRAECCLLLGEAEAARAQLTPLGARSDCEPQRMLLLARCADALDDPVTAHTFWSRLQARADLDPPTRATATARTRALAEVPAVSLARALALAELDAAVQALAQVCAAHPEFAPAWRERGVGEQLLGHAEAALQCLDRAIGLAPDEVQGHDHKATTLARLNRLPEALATVAAGLERCPDAPQLRLRQGALLASAGQWEAALAVFTALAEAVPDHPNVWGNRADAESRLGRPQAAAASLRRFLAVNQERGHPRLAMAREQLWRLEHPDQRRDPEAAARHLERAAAARTAAEALPALQAALTADPLAGNAWFGHGACLLQLERTDAALASLAQAEALLGPTEDVVALRASALLAAGQAEAALACYQRHLARGTPGPNARRGQVLVLTLLGRHADAAQILAELLATEPDDVTLRQAWDKATVAARQPPRA